MLKLLKYKEKLSDIEEFKHLREEYEIDSQINY